MALIEVDWFSYWNPPVISFKEEGQKKTEFMGLLMMLYGTTCKDFEWYVSCMPVTETTIIKELLHKRVQMGLFGARFLVTKTT